MSNLRELSENPEIVIKKADKGSAVVVMNSTDYLREGYRQLSDPNFYTKLGYDSTEEVASNVTKLTGPIPEGAILCTLDVSSLYNNNPNNEGMLAVAEKLRNDHTKTPMATFILDLLKLVLHSMNFTFDGDHYLQTGGTAMGTSLAPNYANLSWLLTETTDLEKVH